MKKILIGGCGGAPSEGVVKSLRLSNKKEELIGIGSEPTDLILSNADKNIMCLTLTIAVMKKNY